MTNDKFIHTRWPLKLLLVLPWLESCGCGRKRFYRVTRYLRVILKNWLSFMISIRSYIFVFTIKKKKEAQGWIVWLISPCIFLALRSKSYGDCLVGTCVALQCGSGTGRPLHSSWWSWPVFRRWMTSVQERRRALVCVHCMEGLATCLSLSPEWESLTSFVTVLSPVWASLSKLYYF